MKAIARLALAALALAASAVHAADTRYERLKLNVSRSAPVQFLGHSGTQFGIAGLFYAGGTYAKSEKGRRIGAVGMTALSATSFSGQTAMAFSMASIVTEEYDSPLAMALCFGLAAGISAARTSTNDHFGRDLAVQAAVGTVVGKGLSRFEKKFGWGRFLYTTGDGLFFRRKF